MVCRLAPGSVADLLAVQKLAAAGKIRIPPDRVFPLQEAAAAHAYCESGNRAGKVVLTV
jgi:NADPH:quinone reductase-like Zn-dependent oxidoreductase